MMKMKLKRYGYIRIAYVLILSIVLGMCFGWEGNLFMSGAQTEGVAVKEVSEEKEITEVDLSISTGQDSGGGETVTVERVVVESASVESASVETCTVETGVVEGKVTVTENNKRKIELSVSERFREGYSFKKDGLTVIVKIGGEECGHGTIDILEEGKKVHINSVEISSTSSPSPKPEVTGTPEPPTVTPNLETNPPGNVTATPNPPTDKPTADPSISSTNPPTPATDKTEKPTVKPTESPVASVQPTESAGPDSSEKPTVSPDTSFPPVESADPGSSEGPTVPTDAPSQNPTESPSSSPVITDTGSVETAKPDMPVPYPSISPITPPTYTITFNANGGVVSEKSITYTAEQLGTIKLPEPTRKDYLFIGWYDGKTRVEKITVVKNVSLKAQWVKKKKISGYYSKLDLKKILKLSSDVKIDEGSIKIEKKFRKNVKINQKKKLVTVKKYFKKAKLSLKINGKEVTVTVNVKLPQPVIKVTRAKKAIAYTTGVYRKFNFKYVYQKGATRAVAEYYSQKKGKYVKCSSIQNRLKGAYANVRKGTSVFFRVTIYYGKYKSPISTTKELKG